MGTCGHGIVAKTWLYFSPTSARYKKMIQVYIHNAKKQKKYKSTLYMHQIGPWLANGQFNIKYRIKGRQW